MSMASFWTPKTPPCGHVHLGGAYRTFGNANADRWESGREKSMQSARNRGGATVRIVRIVCIADRTTWHQQLG